MEKKLRDIVHKFKIESMIDSIGPLGEGFINDTYLVKTAGDRANYLLQKKNKYVFRDIPGMMQNIDMILQYLKGIVSAQGGDPEREAMTIIETKEGKLFFLDDMEEYWTMTLFITDHLVFDKVDTPELAFAGGKGIGKFQALLSDFNEPLVETIPGFHNIKFRFQQWDQTLLNDPKNRKKDLGAEISWIEERRPEMLRFWELVENGTIPKRVTHNDTKISNILFDKNKEVLCVVDLDTVLNSPVLNDFGDAIRSYANTGQEDDPNLGKVDLNMEYFQAFTKGYLSEAFSFLTRPELDNLAFSARYITYEQVLRFLMDYIDGDKYYKTHDDGHNLVRTRAQYRLLTRIEARLPELKDVVDRVATSVNNESKN